MVINQKVIFGNCRQMTELKDDSIHLMVTSPPYFNAPFDYPDLFTDYEEYLDMLEILAKELYRVLAPGRIAAFVTDDMLVNGTKYPIVSDTTRIMLNAGFRYRDKIVWKKPDGYTRISKRSGVLLQHPYPMYFYPDNLQESILLFQNGKFDYSYGRSLPEKIREESKIDIKKFNKQKWYLTIWEITNVLPLGSRLEKGIAAFPDEIPKRLIKLFSYIGETVLDPFLGSGTTMKVASELQRNSVGYEIDEELKEIIKLKLNIDDSKITIRKDAKKLRTKIQSKIMESSIK